MSHKKYRLETNCLNCGEQVLGKFCQNCGQENIEQRDSFVHMIGHFISDYLHFDSKFFRSLVPLFTKPGFLTKEYWEGRRTYYVPPLRLFFFVTIIFMLATSYFYNRFGSQMKNAMIRSGNSLGSIDTVQINSLPDTAKVTLPQGRTYTAKELRKRISTDNRQVKKLHAGVDMVFKNLKYVTFFLLPIYALIFKVLYLRRRPFYIDHLIYVMHLQTFTYIFLSIAFVVPLILNLDISLVRQVLFFSLLIYIFFSLHRLYHQQVWKTIIKSILATVALFMVTMIAVVGTAAIDAIFVQ